MAKWYSWILSPIGTAVGNMPTKEELADRWIRENVPNPADYSATLATLTNDITRWGNSCGDYIHTRNPLYNRANGRSICQAKIEQLYADDLIGLKAQEYQDAEDLKGKGLQGNSKIFYAIALVIVVMIIIVLILKM